jgi:hypothetical protein
VAAAFFDGTPVAVALVAAAEAPEAIRTNPVPQAQEDGAVVAAALAMVLQHHPAGAASEAVAAVLQDLIDLEQWAV